MKKFDYFNLFYGLGAAIILTATLFKVMDWMYADEFFIIGLCSEVVVFLISSFSWTSASKEYQWERVFPQLSSDVPEIPESVEFYQDWEGVYQGIGELKHSMTALSSEMVDLKQMVSQTKQEWKSLSHEVSATKESMNVLHEKTQHLNNLLDQPSKYTKQQ